MQDYRKLVKQSHQQNPVEVQTNTVFLLIKGILINFMMVFFSILISVIIVEGATSLQGEAGGLFLPYIFIPLVIFIFISSQIIALYRIKNPMTLIGFWSFYPLIFVLYQSKAVSLKMFLHVVDWFV